MNWCLSDQEPGPVLPVSNCLPFVGDSTERPGINTVPAAKNFLLGGGKKNNQRKINYHAIGNAVITLSHPLIIFQS